jgi:SAC3 domain-containing protein 1
MDREKMVKEYSRPAAGKDIRPEHLRPFPVLLKTVQYLLQLPTEFSSSDKWPTVYGFVVDRLRSARQDMIVQEFPVDESVAILEAMMPFYLEAEYKCEVTQCRSYDKKLHSAEVNECFSRWIILADTLEKVNEEILGAFLLRYCEQTNVLILLMQWRTRIRESTFDQLSMIILSYKMDNYVKFFKELENSSYLYRLAVWPKYGQVRLNAFRIMSAAYSKSKIPTAVVQKWLAFPSEVNVTTCYRQLTGKEMEQKENVIFLQSVHDNEVQPTSLDWLCSHFNELL